MNKPRSLDELMAALLIGAELSSHDRIVLNDHVRQLEKDKERLDWLHEHDSWQTANGVSIWTARIDTGVPEDDMLSNPMDVREAIDRARAS